MLNHSCVRACEGVPASVTSCPSWHVGSIPDVIYPVIDRIGCEPWRLSDW